MVNAQKEAKQFVFGWKFEPIHPSQLSDALYEAIVSGLKEIPKLEQFTVISKSFADDEERQVELDGLIEQSPAPELSFLNYSSKARVRDLKEAGVRKVKEYYIFFTHTVESGVHEAKDQIEALLAKAGKFWVRNISGRASELDYETTQSLLYDGFEAWLDWSQLISTKMSLKVSPMDKEDFWAYLYRQIHGRKPPMLCPHWLMQDDRGLRQEYARDQSTLPCAIEPIDGSELHISSHLIPNKNYIPQPDKEWVYLPAREKYVGVVTFEQPPDGWRSEDARFTWLWDEVISQEKVVDAEIITQYSWVNPRDSLMALQRYTQQQKGASSTAEEKKKVNKHADLQLEEAEEAQESLMRGDVPVFVGIAILVYADSLQALESSLRYVKNRFRLPAVVIQEQDYAWRVWLQTLPLKWEGLYLQPYDMRLKLRASDALAFAQFMGTKSRSDGGPEFIAENGGSPIFVGLEDTLGSPRHGVFFGRSGSGKSVLVAIYLLYALSIGMQVTMIDLPKNNGLSTYTWLVNFLGGAEFDTGKSSNNLFELIDVRGLEPKLAEQRLQSFYKSANNIVKSLVLDNRSDSEPLPITAIESLITLAVSAFYRDPTIQERCASARSAGIGTQEWEAWPTLTDLYPFFNHQRLNLEDFGTDLDKAMNFIRLRLRYWMDSPLGNAINKPSSFDGSSPLTMFALRDLSSNEEAGLLGLSAQTAATRRALSAPRSLFYVDEASVLLQFAELAKSVGKLMAIGRAAGLSVLLATQDPNILEECAAGHKIRQNISFRVTGRINKDAIETFGRMFGYEESEIKPNAEEEFLPSLDQIYSRWLVDDDGLKTPCRYYPPLNLLGITANDPIEVEIRSLFQQWYPTNKYEALGRFSQYMASVFRQGKVLKRLPEGVRL